MVTRSPGAAFLLCRATFRALFGLTYSPELGTANRHRQSNSLFHQKFLKFNTEITRLVPTVRAGISKGTRGIFFAEPLVTGTGGLVPFSLSSTSGY